MYNGKYVSIEFIIDEIQKDYGFTRSMDKYEIADDVFRAVGLIGVPLAFIRRTTDGIGDNPDVIAIKDYSAELPCDLRQIEGVRTHEDRIPLIEDSSTFKDHTNSTGETSNTANDKLVYHVNDNYIFTNFEEGNIEISYLAFPTDARGVPLIPDNDRYIMGVISFVAERIGFREWWSDNLSDKKYEHLKSERAWYMPSAAGALNMPSYDGAESIKNRLSRMMKGTNEHAYGFKYLNSKEQLLTHK